MVDSDALGGIFGKVHKKVRGSHVPKTLGQQQRHTEDPTGRYNPNLG